MYRGYSIVLFQSVVLHARFVFRSFRVIDIIMWAPTRRAEGAMLIGKYSDKFN